MPVAVLLIVFLMTSHVPAKFGLVVLLHMVTFFIVAMVCHGELAHDRPSPKHLTNFYLLMSIGGVLGGLFNAFVAPIVFTFTSEYPITLVIACFLLPSMFEEKDKKIGNWTHILDVLCPLAVFFICCQLQTSAKPFERLRVFKRNADDRRTCCCLRLPVSPQPFSSYRDDIRSRIVTGDFSWLQFGLFRNRQSAVHHLFRHGPDMSFGDRFLSS